jgi:hypothetical protein
VREVEIGAPALGRAGLMAVRLTGRERQILICVAGLLNIDGCLCQCLTLSQSLLYGFCVLVDSRELVVFRFNVGFNSLCYQLLPAKKA